VIKPGTYRSQTGFYVAQTFTIGELGKTHGQKLIPTGEALILVIAAVAAYALLKLVSWKVLHQLRENGLAKVHPLIVVSYRPSPKGTKKHTGQTENS